MTPCGPADCHCVCAGPPCASECTSKLTSKAFAAACSTACACSPPKGSDRCRWREKQKEKREAEHLKVEDLSAQLTRLQQEIGTALSSARSPIRAGSRHLLPMQRVWSSSTGSCARRGSREPARTASAACPASPSPAAGAAVQATMSGSPARRALCTCTFQLCACGQRGWLQNSWNLQEVLFSQVLPSVGADRARRKGE